MKRSELFFSFLLVPLDFAMIILAGISAYYIRYADFFQKYRPVIFNLDFYAYLRVVLVVAVLWLVVFAFAGLYSIRSAPKQAKEVDELIQSDPNLSKAETLRLYDFADEYHLTFKYAADLLGTKVLKTEVAEIAGIPIVEVKKTPLDGWGRIIKRAFDVIGSLFFLGLASPVLLLTALIIKLDSPGPVFYLDYRSGQANKRFLFYKFRSMIAYLCDGECPSATEAG